MTKKTLILSIVVAVAFVSHASATTWTGANSDDWLDVLNWDTGVPPEGPLAVGGIGSGGDLIMSPTATFQPVANSGETIGGTVINNYPSTTSISLITFESGSFGDFYNLTGPYNGTGQIDYDIQAGAVVTVANSFVQSFSVGSGPMAMTLGGTLNTGEYFNGGLGLASFDILPGGLMTIPGDATTLIDSYITAGYITTSDVDYQIVSDYNATLVTTSVFAELLAFPLGDFNKDGNVTTADYDIMKSNWLTDNNGTGWALNENGEVTGDGLVFLEDFALFKETLFMGPASALGSAIPEPNTVALLLAAIPAWLVLRFRKTRA